MTQLGLLAACKAVARNQDVLNRRVNPDWQKANYPFYRALWREAGESIDHLGWEWWKKPKTDESSRAQFHLELADMLHFGISMWLMDAAKGEKDMGVAIEETGHRLFNDILGVAAQPQGGSSHERTICAVEDVVESAMQYIFDGTRLFHAARLSGLEPAGLLAMYFGKNVLNVFRQNNGYKDGTYLKNWAVDAKAENGGNVEDNVVLYEVLSNPDFGLVGAQDIGSEPYMQRVYDELTRRYKAVLHHHGRIPDYSQEK